jgi:hypothetical protein
MMSCGLVGRCQHLLRVGVADFSEMLVINNTTLHDALEKKSYPYIAGVTIMQLASHMRLISVAHAVCPSK